MRVLTLVILIVVGPAAAAGASNHVSPRALHADRRHRLLQFRQAPGAREREILQARGAAVVQYVPDNGWIVNGNTDLDVSNLDLLATDAVPAGQKISPELGAWRSRSGGAARLFLVEFYPDVSNTDARVIAGQEGLTVRENPDLLPWHLMLAGTVDDAARLAAWDEVAYVFPASRELQDGVFVHACAGAVTANGAVGQYVRRLSEGWDGEGQGGAALTYRFAALTGKQPADLVRAEIQRAMAAWSAAAEVSFSEGGNDKSPRHIEILFGARSHGDLYPFDGPGRMLAHTFYPAPPNPEPIAGDMHLDGDEDWRIGADTDIYSVVLHELGHALGLGHSDIPGTVMYTYYGMHTELTDSDIAAIREIYAAAGTTAAPPVEPEAPTTQPVQPVEPTQPSQPAQPTQPTAPATPVPKDSTPPVLRVTAPPGTTIVTTAAAIDLRGTAADASGIDRVVWSTNTGKAGIANGTDSWTIDAVPLLKGTTYLTIRAYDPAGNSSWRSLMVTRR